MSVSITFTERQSVAADGGTLTVTFAGISFGAAASDRIIAVCVHGESTDAPTACTIDGVAASLVASISNTVPVVDLHTFWFVAELPSGTSGDIVVDVTGGTDTWDAGVFRVVGAVASPMSDTDSSQGSGASLDLTGLTIPTGGAGIVGFTNASGGTATTWTNATSAYDAGGTYRKSAAIVTAAGTATINADSATAQQCMAGIAFDPVPSGKGPPFDSMKYLRHLLVR